MDRDMLVLGIIFGVLMLILYGGMMFLWGADRALAAAKREGRRSFEREEGAVRERERAKWTEGYQKGWELGWKDAVEKMVAAVGGQMEWKARRVGPEPTNKPD